MPAAQTIKTCLIIWMSTGILAISALPVVSGDWTAQHVISESSAGAGQVELGQSGAPTRLSLSTDRDYGTFTLGGEFSRGGTPLRADLPGGSDSEQVNLRAGYDFGQSLGFVTFGRQQDPGENGAGPRQILGLGMRVSLNRALQLTGEFLHYSPAHSGNDNGHSQNSLSIKAAFRF